MRISRGHTGILAIFLTPLERKMTEGPYQVNVINSKRLQICTSPDGYKGSAMGDDGSWRIQARHAGIENHFPNPFGVTEVSATFDRDTKCFTVQMPHAVVPAKRARKDLGKTRKDLVSHGLEVAHLKAEPLKRVEPVEAASHYIPLAELVRMVNARRAEANGNMVFSVDAEGYLRVMVEYGR